MANDYDFDITDVDFVLSNAEEKMRRHLGCLDIATALLRAGRCFPTTPYAAVFLLDRLSADGLYSMDPAVLDLLRWHPDVRALTSPTPLT